MKKNITISVISALWRIILLALTFMIGLIGSRLLFYQLGIAPPRLSSQAPESIAVYYLFTGSLILTLGLFPLIQNIGGNSLSRFLIVFFFLFAWFGISVSVENSIYTTESNPWIILILLVPSLIFALVATLLTKTQSGSETFSGKLKEFFKTQTTKQWLWKLFLAIVSFPIIYFMFGIMVSPFVMDYYQQNNLSLTVPTVGVIIGVQVFRSILFLLVTLPILITWMGNKIQLVLFLGLAHFVFVFSYDFVLAIQLPFSLELIHGLEILLDSIVYAWVIVKLLSTK